MCSKTKALGVKIIQKLQEIKNASLTLSVISIEKRNKIILDVSNKILEQQEKIIFENKKDLEKLEEWDILRDRLLLNKNRIKAMAESWKKLINTKDPLEKYSKDNLWIISTATEWLKIKKQAIPLWVVSCIYEARPNVTIDIFNMCIKSGNAVILRWGSQAENSNNILISLIQEVLEKNGMDKNIVFNFPLEREKLNYLYKANGLVDVIIPRGWRKLIDTVREKSLVPVIETWAWVVHLYLDDKISEENFEKSCEIIINAKTSRPSVCNAIDTLVLHKDLWEEKILFLYEKLKKSWIIILNDEEFIDYNAEQLSLKLNIKIAKNIDVAIKHIQTYSTKHSDWILSDSSENIEKFKTFIDSSVVYVNTSTRFSDWECFGFGWEIWISTQKLHTRWPMWAEALVSYKYVVESDWKVR